MYSLNGPVGKTARIDNKQYFSPDANIEGQYLSKSEPSARCFHIFRAGLDHPIGFTWIDISVDEFVPEELLLQVEYVYVIPDERGQISEWLSGAIVEELQRWILRENIDLHAIQTLYSTSSHISRGGERFLRHLHAALDVWCRSTKLKLKYHQ